MIEEIKEQLEKAKQLKDLHDKVIEELEKKLKELEKSKLQSDRKLGEAFWMQDSFGNEIQLMVVTIQPNGTRSKPIT